MLLQFTHYPNYKLETCDKSPLDKIRLIVFNKSLGKTIITTLQPLTITNHNHYFIEPII